jgi:hypothetical protein
MAVWPDGYYMGMNNSSSSKKDIYVFQRSQMLTGGTAQFVGFDNPYRPTTIDGFMCVPPVDNDGPAAPSEVPDFSSPLMTMPSEVARISCGSTSLPLTGLLPPLPLSPGASNYQFLLSTATSATPGTIFPSPIHRNWMLSRR